MSETIEKTFDQNKFSAAISKSGVAAAALGAKRIRFTCRVCGAANRVTIEQIARQTKVACGGCARVILLQDKAGGFGKAMRGE